MKNLFVFLLILSSSKTAFAEGYERLNTIVRQYQHHVEDKRRHIKELAEQKATLHDQAAIRAILDETIVDAKEIKENFVKFQKEKKRLMYEFPQKNDVSEHQYKRFELETIEEMNTVSNIDLRLKGVLSKMEKTYEKPPEVIAMEKKKKEEANKPAATSQPKSVKAEPTPESSRPKLSY